MMKHVVRSLAIGAIATSTFVLGTILPDRALAGGAAFPTQTCAATNGFVLPHGGNNVTILASPGDVFTLATGVSTGLPALQPSNAFFPVFPIPASYTVPAGAVSVTFRSGGGVGDGFVNITCASSAAAEGETTGGAITEATSNIGANSQTDASSTGVSNNTQNRLGGGRDNTASQNRVFLSTQNLPGAQSQFGQPDWNAWIAAEGRSYQGGFDGWSGDVVAGVDTLISNDLLVGALLAYGRVDITSGATRSEVTSLAIGAYFAKRFGGDLFLDGFVSVARPEYQTQGTTFNSNRVSASMTLTGSYTGGRFNVTPFGKLSGYRETLPAFFGTGGAVAANTVSNVTLNVGAKVEPLAPLASGILPYISLSADAASNTSTLGGSTSFVSPRIGVGFGAALGGGYLSVDLDAGKVRENVRDMGLRATYEFTF